MSIRDRPHQYVPASPPGGYRPSPGEWFVLHDGHLVVAWIAGRSLGFGVFDDEHAAAAFGWAVHVALSQWTAHEWHAAPPATTMARLEISAAVDPGARWVLADRLPIARLVDPRTVRLDHAMTSVLDALGRRPATPPHRGPVPRDPGASAAPTEREVAREPFVAPGAGVGIEVPVPLPAGALDLRSAARAVSQALSRRGDPRRSSAAPTDGRGATPTVSAEPFVLVHAELGTVD